MSPFPAFEPARCLWDFGDGTTVSDPAPSHRYARPGQYTVKVGLSGDKGAKRTTRHIQLQIPRVRLGGVPKGK